MSKKSSTKGFTLIEVLVAVGIFLIFALGVYGGLQLVFKIVYQSRLRILETSVLSTELEIVRNIPFESVGIAGGIPVGILPYTKTITYDGVSFDIVTTVRNVDDPFDGTIGGTPNDTSPADYKIVEMSIICSNCDQATPVILNTVISPKGLEGASQNGALFINVFNDSAEPVQGANVSIINTLLDPDLTINDVTGNDGWLRIVDTPTGTVAYNITITKPGYSTAGTGGLKAPASVSTQQVTEIFFSIDQLANLDIKTVNSACVALGGTDFNIHIDKLISTNPDVYKYSQNLTTDGAGLKSLTGLEFGKYYLDFTGSGYDLAGAGPVLPLKLNPGASQTVTAVLRPHVATSLLVSVLDSGTSLPLSDASVRLYDGTYDKTLTTGLGYTRQTDWSGGSGQLNFTIDSKYFSDSGTVDINSPAGDVKLKKVGQHYLNSGWLESSIIDFGEPVNFNGIVWTPTTQPAQCGANPVTFQVATSDIAEPESWDYLGPDGTNTTYYTVSNSALWSGHDGGRYLRYKMFLYTADEDFTPLLSEVAFTYTNSCTPPGQTFFNDISAGTYTLEVNRSGYLMNSGSLDIVGNTDTTVNLSVNE